MVRLTDYKDKIFICGNPNDKHVLHWSKNGKPEEFPKMKIAILETIKWRIRKFFTKIQGG